MVLEITGPPILVVMGVAGTGKSTVAGLLAERLNWELQEGDDLHRPQCRKDVRRYSTRRSRSLAMAGRNSCLDREQAGTRRTGSRHLLRSETQLS